MRQDLIKLIEAQEDVTNAIALTHNIDFVFIQLIVLPALRRCGRPTFTVFADAQCAIDTYAYQSPVLSGLGTRYRVVPVAMEPGFRFHPKALLLSGPEKATLLVGSGNLTLGGWRENAEVWVHFDSDQDTTAPFAAFRTYLLDILARVPLTDPVRNEVDEAFDEGSRPWAKEMEPPAGLLGRIWDGPALLEQMTETLGGEPVENLVVCSPYFDSEGEALVKLLHRFRPKYAEILVQKKYPGLPKTASGRLTDNVKAIPVGFTREGTNGVERESFIHSKFYALTGQQRTVVFAGSANCSQAALTIPGRNGNAELLAIQTLRPEEFTEDYLKEIPKLEGELILSEPREEVEKEIALGAIRILAARYENGLLRMAYKCRSGVAITKCFVDGIEVPFSVETETYGSAEVSGSPRTVVLQGTEGSEWVRSNQCWIDVESELRFTSRGRSLAGIIRESVQAARWGIGAWKEILDVFYKHLQYLPPRGFGWGHSGSDPRVKKLAEFTAQDVFSSAYGLPSLGSAVRAGLVTDRVHSLQQMLLRWFGIHVDDGPEPNGTDQPGDVDDDDEDVVDRPERIPPRKTPPVKSKPVTDADRKRARKSVAQMTQAMTNEEFLTHRPPELLAADLKIAAVLLRVGLKEGWVSENEFFDATRLIWSSLFFSSPGDPTQGWLERRQRSVDDADEFAVRMASPELSAAMAAWAMTASSGRATPEHAGHVLARVLAVARLPWLWRGGEPERIKEELSRMLVNTKEDLSEIKTKEIENAWLRLIRRGEALRALEETLRNHSPAEIRHRVQEDEIGCGDLLWQGTSGYCVVLQDCRRSQSNNVPVLCLQGVKKETSFKPGYLIPLKSLLDTRVLSDKDRLGPAAGQAILELIEELAEPFRTKQS